MRLMLSGQDFFFDLSAEWWLHVRVPQLFGGFKQLGARLFGTRGVLGSEKSMDFNHSSQEKHPRGWRDIWAQQGLGTARSCSCQSQGMNLAKGKEMLKNWPERRERPRSNLRARKNALQWDTQRASPLYLIRKKNESDLITAHEHLLREKTAKPL